MRHDQTNSTIKISSFNMTTLEPFEINNTFERNISEDIWGPVRSHLAIVSVLSIIYGLIFIFGFFGNIITCVVVMRNKYMHTVTNFYLFSLAVSDLLLLVSGLPVEMYQIWFKYPYIFGETFCILQGLAAETSANATVLTITAFTIERYIAICYPFVSRNTMKLKRATRYIILIWVLSFIFAIPQAIKLGLVYGKDAANNVIQELSICSIKNDFLPHSFEISMMLFFVIPMTIITILYILIGLKLRRPNVQNTDKRDPILVSATGGFGQEHMDHDDFSSYVIHSQSTKRVVKMLVAVVVTFFVCWAPFQMQRLVAVYGYAENDTSNRMFILYQVVTNVSGVLYYLSAVINPILYNIMSNKFRQAFQDTLKICPCKHHRNTRRNSGEIGNCSLPRLNFELKNYNSLASASGSNRAIYNSYFEKVTDFHQRPLVISFRKPPFNSYTINRSQFDINNMNRIEEFSLNKCSHSCSLPGISIRKNNFNEFPSTVKVYTFDGRTHHKQPCAIPRNRDAKMFYSE